MSDGSELLREVEIWSWVSDDRVRERMKDFEDGYNEGYGESRREALAGLEDVERGIRTLDELLVELRGGVR